MSEWSAETAEWYAAKYGECITNRLAVDAIEVAPDAVVVDVGCGTGSALRRIAPAVPDGTLIGVDPIRRMVEIARKRASKDPNGHRIEFREAPAEQLPLEDNFADVVFAFDSIDHWQKLFMWIGVVAILGAGYWYITGTATASNEAKSLSTSAISRFTDPSRSCSMQHGENTWNGGLSVKRFERRVTLRPRRPSRTRFGL